MNERAKARAMHFAILIAERQADDYSTPEDGINVQKSYTVGNNRRPSGFRKSLRLEAGGQRGSTREDRAWRESVLIRDGFRCVKCGSGDDLEADHIRPVHLYPELRFNVDNGQTLCHGCHVQTETYGHKVHRLAAVDVSRE